jgi:NitT/TauT family transport system substrate-binding protein
VEIITVRVSYRDGISWAPFVLGVETGIFERHGIIVEFIPALSAGEAIAAMRGGDLDVDPIQINVSHLNALAQGENIAIVANRGVFDPDAECSYFAYLARNDRIDGEFTDLANLAGADVSFNVTNVQGYVLDKALEGSGITIDDLEALDIPNAAEIEGLTDGSVDLTNATEPWVTRILEAGDNGILIRAEDILPDADWGVMVYGGSMIGENREKGERFMRAYLEAVAKYNEGKTDENVAILAVATDLEPDFLIRSCWPSFSADGSVNVQSILDFQEWAIARGLLDNPVSSENIWDPSYIEAVSGN